MDEHGKSSELFSVEGAIKHLYYFDKRDILAVITDTLMLSQYSLGPPRGAQEFMKVEYAKMMLSLISLLLIFTVWLLDISEFVMTG